MPVEITCRAPSARRYLRRLRADAVALLGLLALEHYELSLMVVGDRAIERLNREFRGKDRPTDVLSFPQVELAREMRPPSAATTMHGAPPAALGDVVISIDTARRQAQVLGIDPAARIRTLLIHGLLHLIGYDHERSAAAARRMFARERELAALMPAAGAQLAGDSRCSPAAMPAASRRATSVPATRAR